MTKINQKIKITFSFLKHTDQCAFDLKNLNLHIEFSIHLVFYVSFVGFLYNLYDCKHCSFQKDLYPNHKAPTRRYRSRNVLVLSLIHI